ncbi:DUF3798 domain-containing protein [Christensenellaceae bacterium OttesenSCG-928-L17]|nr:DUF3798 domain-containing protein [Christensenellaceae bacterium OttesenSCG-928-L17]
MSKKVLSLVLAALMLFAVVGCRQEGPDASGGDNYKIGIITGTVSQGEEEFQAAQEMLEKYGADRIVTATYPDKFNDEIETTISQVVNLASDPDVKAIVFVQAVPGATAAIEKVRETRPDILFVAGVAQEAPRSIAGAADVVMLVDEFGQGTSIIEQAQKQGATTFIHYSFPRHLGIESIAARREIFIETCETLGIEFVDVTAPDPTGDAGVPGAQQFIVEDVPTQVAKYGADTAFFSTNCSMQEPLIRSVLEQKAIYPLQCCPSPFHGYPAALNIEVQGHEGDMAYMLEQIGAKVSEGGNSGHMSTWPVPINMLMVRAGVEYAIKFCEGNTTGAYDAAAFEATLHEVGKDMGAEELVLSKYNDNDGEIENFYLILSGYYDF